MARREAQALARAQGPAPVLEGAHDREQQEFGGFFRVPKKMFERLEARRRALERSAAGVQPEHRPVGRAREQVAGGRPAHEAWSAAEQPAPLGEEIERIVGYMEHWREANAAAKLRASQISLRQNANNSVSPLSPSAFVRKPIRHLRQLSPPVLRSEIADETER